MGRGRRKKNIEKLKTSIAAQDLDDDGNTPQVRKRRRRLRKEPSLRSERSAPQDLEDDPPPLVECSDSEDDDDFVENSASSDSPSSDSDIEIGNDEVCYDIVCFESLTANCTFCRWRICCPGRPSHFQPSLRRRNVATLNARNQSTWDPTKKHQLERKLARLQLKKSTTRTLLKHLHRPGILLNRLKR